VVRGDREAGFSHNSSVKLGLLANNGYRYEVDANTCFLNRKTFVYPFNVLSCPDFDSSSLYRGDLDHHDLTDHLGGGYGGGLGLGDHGDLGLDLDNDGGHGGNGGSGYGDNDNNGVRSYGGGIVKQYRKNGARVTEINV
jgi:hypothetical protein